MSFKTYENYKPASVDWINQIPAHWELLPTKRSFARKKELNTGMRIENRLALTMKGVVKRRLDDLEGLQASEFETYQIFNKNDLAFKLIDLQNIKTSRVGLVPETGIMSPAYIRLESTGRVEPKYAYWYFMKLYHECIFNELGGGVRQTIGYEELLSIDLPCPPRNEQISIAAFLDRETAKINALIVEQQRLIELLREKGKAVISHAVTKGLNPNALMKDSGVEWLVEVPEHWRKTRIKQLFKPRKSQGHPHLEVLSVYRDYGVIAKNSRSDNINQTPDDLSKYQLVKIGDLVINKMKCWQGSLGISALEGITSPDYVTLSPTHNENNSFLHNALRSNSYASYYIAISNGIRPGQWRIEPKRFLALPLFLPSIEEQLQIASHIEVITRNFSLLEEAALAQLVLLGERRSALVSLAVTGQIDVRGLAAKEEP